MEGGTSCCLLTCLSALRKLVRLSRPPQCCMKRGQPPIQPSLALKHPARFLQDGGEQSTDMPVLSLAPVRLTHTLFVAFAVIIRTLLRTPYAILVVQSRPPCWSFVPPLSCGRKPSAASETGRMERKGSSRPGPAILLVRWRHSAKFLSSYHGDHEGMHWRQIRHSVI